MYRLFGDLEGAVTGGGLTGVSFTVRRQEVGYVFIELPDIVII